jgi:hypothetical protein
VQHAREHAQPHAAVDQACTGNRTSHNRHAKGGKLPAAQPQRHMRKGSASSNTEQHTAQQHTSTWPADELYPALCRKLTLLKRPVPACVPRAHPDQTFPACVPRAHPDQATQKTSAVTARPSCWHRRPPCQARTAARILQKPGANRHEEHCASAKRIARPAGMPTTGPSLGLMICTVHLTI